MPYLLIKSNQTLPPEAAQALLRQASQTAAQLLGKPEQYVMVALELGSPMLFAGNDAPLAYLELKSIGLPAARTTELSAGLTALVGKALQVDPGRIYIEFANASGPLWGWNGATF